MAKLPAEYDAATVERYIDEAATVRMKSLKDTVHTVTTPSVANVEFKIEHGLGYRPTHFVQLSPNAGGVVYKSNTRRVFDEKYAYLKCSAGSVTVELIFF